MEHLTEAAIREAAAVFWKETGRRQFSSLSGGHINRTWLVEEESGEKFVLQQINTEIFQNPETLMENIAGITEFLQKKQPGNTRQRVLTLLSGKTGGYLYRNGQGAYFRAYQYIDHAVCREQVERPEQLYESGRAFGRFQRMLAEYPVEKLTETLPDFHHTPKRYRDFCQAADEDCCGRAAEAAAEIAFIQKRSERFGSARRLLEAGELPLRVTHNDTKLSNVMLDTETGEAVCVIDLDTVMPGLLIFDYGEAIRFGANLAAEDEPDSTKAGLSLELAEQYTRGFLEECGGILWPAERKMLAEGAWLMTMENGMRFLADYLQGDVYYQIKRERHNLDRARSQLALAADMERKWKEFDAMIKSCMEKEKGVTTHR